MKTKQMEVKLNYLQEFILICDSEFVALVRDEIVRLQNKLLK